MSYEIITPNVELTIALLEVEAAIVALQQEIKYLDERHNSLTISVEQLFEMVEK